MHENDDNLPIDTDNEVDDELSSPRTVDVKKALAYRLNNKLSYAKIGELLGHPKQSIHKALKPFLKLIENPQQIECYAENKAHLLNAAEFRMLSEMVDPEKLKSASVNNIAYAFGQLSKEGHLARGESTANIQYYLLNEKENELDAEIEKLESELSGN